MTQLFHLVIAQAQLGIQLFPEVVLIKSVKMRADVPFYILIAPYG